MKASKNNKRFAKLDINIANLCTGGVRLMMPGLQNSQYFMLGR